MICSLRRPSKEGKGRRIFFLGILFVLFLVIVIPARAQLSELMTKDLRLIYYSKAHEYIVPHLARCFQNALAFDERMFNFLPSGKVTIFLEDFDDFGHGGADVVPNNHIDIGLAPFNYVYETVPANERMNWLMNHELIHIVACDKAAGPDRVFRSLFFGKVSATSEAPLSMLYTYLTTPRRYSPRWYHEGIAVFMETWMSGGVGRVLGGYDEMVFRSMVRDSTYIYDVVGLESEGTTIDFQVGVNSYLYGTRFMSYLAYTYGPEKLLAWVTRSDSSSHFFATQFQQVYGKSLDDGWSDWLKFEHTWQNDNLDSIRKYPVTRSRPISSRALGSVSRSFYDSASGKLYAAVRYPGQVSHIVSIDGRNGQVENLCEVKGPALFYVTSLAYNPRGRVLFFTTNNNKWRDVNAFDLATGSTTCLLPESRIGDLAFDQADSSLWGIRHDAGYSTIVRIPYPYTRWNQILTWPYGQDIFDLDVSPDGSMLAMTLAEVNGTQHLITMDVPKLLAGGDSSYKVLFTSEKTSTEDFVFSADNRSLYGSTYSTGVSNIVRYDLATSEMKWLTNSETGFFRPVPVSEDSLVAWEYSGQGFRPGWITNHSLEDVSAVRYLGQGIYLRFPEVASWTLDPPSSRRINIDSLTIYNGEYNGLANLRLMSVYPVVEGYKNLVAYGLRFNIADPLGLYNLNLTGSYTPNRSIGESERLHLSLGGGYLNWKIRGTVNGADFYDLFGPTKVSRKGYSAGITLKEPIISDDPRTMSAVVDLAGYSGLERLPDYQNIATTFDKFVTLNGRLNYRYYIRTLGSVDAEKGIQWTLSSLNTLVQSRFYPLVYTGLDYGFMLPVDHTSLWARTSFGFSPRGRDDPFANFYFGGFGNNWIDYQDVQRYREYYSFPGLELNEAAGTRYGKFMLELDLPPVRFRRAGILNAYCTWARFALFSGVLMTNIDDQSLRTDYLDVGSQVDFRIVLFSNLESTFSVGYAFAWSRNQRAERELMVSLKLL